MKKKLSLFYILFIVTAVWVSCGNDDEQTCYDPTNPECSNYDPCIGKIGTTAYFTIAQRYWPFGENANIFIEDDIVTGGTLKLAAIPQEGAVYTWVLGIDTIVGGSEITIPLGNLPQGIYGNSLTVTKTVDSLCLPLDNGMAQFSRSFTRIDGCDRAILGRFKGVFSHLPNDSTEIETIASSSVESVEPCDLPSNASAIFAINFGLNNDTIRLRLNGGANSQFSFESLNAIDRPEGEFVFDQILNIARADYSIGNATYSFTGRKL